MRTGDLSVRLNAAASLVTPGSRVCDVGCDHAYLPIALCLRGIIPAAIGMDLRPGPLAAAREHVEEAGLSERIELRLSDGLSALREEEADSMVITGMGGRLILQILREAPFAPDSVNEWVLGPQSDEDLLRRGLAAFGLRIAEEIMVEEEGHFYVLIRAVPGKVEDLTDVQAMFGPRLIEKMDPVFARFMETKRNTLEDLLQNLEAASGERAQTRSLDVRRELQMVREVMGNHEMR